MPSPDAPFDEWARFYHWLGRHPLPVKPGTKKPGLDAWKEYQIRQPTLEEIARWDWSGGVGITTNGYIVLDCDDGGEHLLKDRELPPSWTVRTGADGLHRHLASDGQGYRNKSPFLKGENGAKVDIRADGGFVVMPPTRHPETGRPYRWLLPPGTVPLADAPRWILEALKEPEVPEQAPRTAHEPPRTGSDVVARARAYLARVPPAVQGEGGDNHTFTKACSIARGFDLDEKKAVEVLLEWNATCQPPWTEREIRQKVANALKYGTEPIGHLRDTERPRVEQTGGARVESQDPSPDPPMFASLEDAEALWDEPDEPIEWDIEGIVVRSTQGWLSARPKDAKSILSTHMGSRMAAALPVLDHYPVPTARQVLLVQEEDPRRRLKRRLKQFVSQEERDAWLGRFKILIEAGLRLDEPQWQQWLVEQIEKHKTEVLILDVWRWLHHADTNSEKELKPILAFLTEIRRKYGLTILIVTHDSKPKQGPEGSKHSTRITGSWAQWAWAHFGIFLKKAGKTVQVEVEGKDAQDSSFAFRFEGGEHGQPLRLVWEPPRLSAGEARRRQLASYLQERTGEWIDLSTLANAVGVSEDTAKKDLEALCSEPLFETTKMPFGRTRKRVYRYANTPE